MCLPGTQGDYADWKDGPSDLAQPAGDQRPLPRLACMPPSQTLRYDSNIGIIYLCMVARQILVAVEPALTAEIKLHHRMRA